MFLHLEMYQVFIYIAGADRVTGLHQSQREDLLVYLHLPLDQDLAAEQTCENRLLQYRIFTIFCLGYGKCKQRWILMD